jgi:hypothetical protein
MSVHQGSLVLPAPRGPLSQWALHRLSGEPSTVPPPVDTAEGLGDDLQLALYLCYESHYSSLPGVEADREWDPGLIWFRQSLERVFETALAAIVGEIDIDGPVRDRIVDVIGNDDGPSLSSFMERFGTIDQMRDFLVHRSAYQLKEGDPHTFAIPRIGGRAKQLLAQIQSGEYGADAPDREIHSALFASTMRSLGLDARPHAYLDTLPASALALSNLISLFGLNRRWRGALVGHLAVFEMTSVTPMGRYGRALERMGAPDEARRFYDVHVLADAEHEELALEMAGALADDEPSLAPDIVFGARCAVEIERLFAEQLLTGWRPGVRASAHAAA